LVATTSDYPTAQIGNALADLLRPNTQPAAYLLLAQ